MKDKGVDITAELIRKHMLTKPEAMMLCFMEVYYSEVKPSEREAWINEMEKTSDLVVKAFRELLSRNPTHL